MLDYGCWVLDAGCWMLEVGFWILDAGFWMLDAEPSSSESLLGNAGIYKFIYTNSLHQVNVFFFSSV